jgi:hypothetical protein
MEVQIANPIYDVVFKYMMEDNAVAKLVVSSIIKEEVLELEPKPQEHTREKLQIGKDDSSLTVYRLDFSAKIKTPNGQKLIHIEIQKASLPTDIPRFRRYLGEQYIDPNNNISTPSGTIGLQIYCIYFFGKDFGIDAPVLRMYPNIVDDATSEIIEVKSDFVDSLNHKGWVIQINCLKERRRNELEQLLAVFDQLNITKDWHILNVSEENFPEKFRPIIRRLKSAASDKEVKRQMKAEDEFLRYLQDCIRVERDKAIEEKDKTIEESKKSLEESKKSLEEKDKSLAEQQKSLAEKDQSLAEKDQFLAEKDKSLAKKDKEIEELRKLLEKR